MPRGVDVVSRCPNPTPRPRAKPRNSPRQARSTETVRVILEATARILEGQGHAGFTTNAVAERGRGTTSVSARRLRVVWSGTRDRLKHRGATRALCLGGSGAE
jgi:hypothetical protein